MREVHVLGIQTPNGPLSQNDMASVKATLEPYWLVFSVRMDCSDGADSLWLQGRRRSESENSSIGIHLWGQELVGISR